MHLDCIDKKKKLIIKYMSKTNHYEDKIKQHCNLNLNVIMMTIFFIF